MEPIGVSGEQRPHELAVQAGTSFIPTATPCRCPAGPASTTVMVSPSFTCDTWYESRAALADDVLAFGFELAGEQNERGGAVGVAEGVLPLIDADADVGAGDAGAGGDPNTLNSSI